MSRFSVLTLIAGIWWGGCISLAHAQSAEDLNRLIEQANRGSNEARFSLGAIYGHGTGVTRSYARANQYYELAAKAGYAPAQNNLGWAYREGLGVAKDPQRAIYWFRKSALQGNALALQNLGEMYRDGEGVAPDAKAVAQLFLLCAAQPLNQPKSEGSFDNAVLECRRDIGRSELRQARGMEDYRRAAFYFQLALQPNRDYQSGSGTGYERAVKTMQDAKALYDATYPKLDAQAAAWVRDMIANQNVALAEIRKHVERPAVLR
jgi:hypothetical protein